MAVEIYTDVLGPRMNAAIFQMAVDERSYFEPSRTSPQRRIDPTTRMSMVVYDNRLSGVAALMREAVQDRLDEAVAHLGIPAFEPAAFEIQMTSHNDGEFFRPHTDSGSRATVSRALTFVYYFHRQPKAFSGGELIVFGTDGSEEVIEPVNDSMVLFDPRTLHEVRPTTCPSGRFEDGRFTLNGWIHLPLAGKRRASFFDARIFTPIGSWRGAPRTSSGAPRTSSGTVTTGTAGTMTPAAGISKGDCGAADQGRVASRPEADEVRHLRGLLRLYGDLHRQGEAAEEIDVRPELSGTDFFAMYYTRNRPVLVPGVLASSKAVATWSPTYFAERFADVEVEIMSGREDVDNYETLYRQLSCTVTMADLGARLEGTDSSNDFYLVARNYFFENPALAHLRNDLSPPPDIIDDADRSRGTAKLWFGPRGTVTPLHFDEHSILFTQIYGRKQFILVPAFDTPLMYVRDVYYSEVDPEHVDIARHPLFAGASLMHVTVGPGDGLFLPTGWWHWAKSLSTSISATFSSFAIRARNTRLVLA